MKFKITYILPNGDEDDFIIEGEKLESIRQEVKNELRARGGTNPHSEQLE